MRGLRSTIALFIVLAGLGAYIYFYASKTEDTSRKDRLFPAVASDNIEELTVKNDAGEVTSLKKEDGKWMITSPVQTRGSDLEASGIANALAGLDMTRVVEESPTDVKEYGLDQPSVEIAFKSNDGKPSGKLLIGKKTATGGNLYARKDDEQRVVLIAEYNSTTFNRSTFDLRDKAVVSSFDRTKVDGLDVTLAAGGFELAKKDSDWSMVKPLVARADTSAADGLVSSVESLQMKSVVSTSPTPDDLKTYGLDRPTAVVNLHLGTDRVSVAVGGTAEEDTVYAKDLSKPDVYTIQKTAADDLEKKAEDYRRKDMFDMRAFTATRLEITRNGKTTAFDKVKGTGENAQDTWKRVSPAGADPDKDKFQTFVAALADIRASSFVGSGTRTGLDNPEATIVVKFDEGKKEDRVRLARVGANAYASRPDDPGAALVDASKVEEALTSIDEFTK